MGNNSTTISVSSDRNAILAALFPSPTKPLNEHYPQRWPGITAESTAAVQSTLKDNHEKWHIFFNEQRFHNHAAHHLLAIWALGAPGEVIEAAYDRQIKVHVKPAFPSPREITSDNFNDHLGDERYYRAYLDFFTARLADSSPGALLESYIFSCAANFVDDDKKGKPNPVMLVRFMSGLLHPFIHTGYGVEFGVPGLLAEGLAQTAVHEEDMLTGLFTPAFFSPVPPVVSDRKPWQNVHAFTILSRVLAMRAFDPAALKAEEAVAFNEFVGQHHTQLRELTDLWWYGEGDGGNELAAEDYVYKKTVELGWMTSLTYAVGGWSAARTAQEEAKANSQAEKRDFVSDFFLMHCVTSSLFVPSIVSILPSSSAHIIMRAYFATSLAHYLSRGRPPLPLTEFFSAAAPPTKGPMPEPTAGTLLAGQPLSRTPDAWLPVLQSTLVHPDEHLCKTQRALVHWARVAGATPAGHFGAGGAEPVELPGAESVDGTLFVRAAGLTMQSLGWAREGEPLGNWDFHGFAD